MSFRGLLLGATLFTIVHAFCAKQHTNDTSLSSAARIASSTALSSAAAPCPCIGKENLLLIREERKLLENERKRAEQLLLKEIEARRRLERLVSRLIRLKYLQYSYVGSPTSTATSSSGSTTTIIPGTNSDSRIYEQTSGVQRELPSSFSMPSQRRPPPPTGVAATNPRLVNYDILPPESQRVVPKVPLTPKEKERRAKWRAERRKILLDLVNLEQAEKLPNNQEAVEQRKQVVIKDIEHELPIEFAPGKNPDKKLNDAYSVEQLRLKRMRDKIALERHRLAEQRHLLEKNRHDMEHKNAVPVSSAALQMERERTKLEEERAALERARQRLEKERGSSERIKFDVERILHKKPVKSNEELEKEMNHLSMLQEKLNLEREQKWMQEEKKRMVEEKARLSQRTDAQHLHDERLERDGLYYEHKRIAEDRHRLLREKQLQAQQNEGEKRARIELKKRLIAQFSDKKHASRSEVIAQEKSQLKTEIAYLSTQKKTLGDELLTLENSPLPSPDSGASRSEISAERIRDMKEVAIAKKKISIHIQADQNRLKQLENIPPSPSPIPSTSPAPRKISTGPSTVSELSTSEIAGGSASSVASTSSLSQNSAALHEIQKKLAAVEAEKLRIHEQTMAEQELLKKETEYRVAQENLAKQQAMARLEKEHQERLRIEEQRKAQEALAVQKRIEIANLELAKAKLERERLAQAEKEALLEKNRLELEKIKQQEQQAAQKRIAEEAKRIERENLARQEEQKRQEVIAAQALLDQKRLELEKRAEAKRIQQENLARQEEQKRQQEIGAQAERERIAVEAKRIEQENRARQEEQKRQEVIAAQSQLELQKMLADSQQRAQIVNTNNQNSGILAQLAAIITPSPSPKTQLQAGPVAQFQETGNLIASSGNAHSTQQEIEAAAAAKLAREQAALLAEKATLAALENMNNEHTAQQKRQAALQAGPVTQLNETGLSIASSGNTQSGPTQVELDAAAAAKLEEDKRLAEILATANFHQTDFFAQVQQQAELIQKKNEEIAAQAQLLVPSPSPTSAPYGQVFGQSNETGNLLAAGPLPPSANTAQTSQTSLISEADRNRAQQLAQQASENGLASMGSGVPSWMQLAEQKAKEAEAVALLERERKEALEAEKAAKADEVRKQQELAAMEANQPANSGDSETARLNKEKDLLKTKRDKIQVEIAAMNMGSPSVSMYTTMKKTVLTSQVRKYDDELAKIALELENHKNGLAALAKQIKEGERAIELAAEQEKALREQAQIRNRIKWLDKELLYMPADERPAKLAQREKYADSWSGIQGGLGNVNDELDWLRKQRDKTAGAKAEDEAILARIIDLRSLYQIELEKLAALDQELEGIVRAKKETDYTDQDHAKFKDREELQKGIEKLRADELDLLKQRGKLSGDILKEEYSANPSSILLKREYPKPPPRVSPTPSPAPPLCDSNCMGKIEAARKRAILKETNARNRVEQGLDNRRKAAEAAEANRQKSKEAAKAAAEERARKAKEYRELKREAIAQGKPVPIPPWQKVKEAAEANRQEASGSGVSISPTPKPLTLADLKSRVNETYTDEAALDSGIVGIKEKIRGIQIKFQKGIGTPVDMEELRKLKQENRDAEKQRRKLEGMRARAERKMKAIRDREERARLAQLKEQHAAKQRELQALENQQAKLQNNNQMENKTMTKYHYTTYVDGKAVANSTTVHHSTHHHSVEV